MFGERVLITLARIKEGKKMKVRGSILGFISVLTVMVSIGSGATTKKAISEKDFFKTWSGTWVNTDYPGSAWVPQKIICHPDGTLETYSLATLSQRTCLHKITLMEQWADSKGNIWYKAHKKCPALGGIAGYEYGKISDSGNTYELIYRVGSEQIEEWEPDSPLYTYCIYHRQ
jgi:hypothetical protein